MGYKLSDVNENHTSLRRGRQLSCPQLNLNHKDCYRLKFKRMNSLVPIVDNTLFFSRKGYWDIVPPAWAYS